MKFIDEFRDGEVAKVLVQKIQVNAVTSTTYRFMEFCGGHTHAIFRYGIPDLLPENVKMIHGPGCPVCVLPMSRIDQAIQLALSPDVILCSYGDMLRVPGTAKMSLLKARADGADVRMVYSVSDALVIAEANPTKKVIFFAIGFETTTPPTALALIQAKKKGLTNFFAFCNHVMTPPAMKAILDSSDSDYENNTPPLQGFIGPAHVSTVIGSNAFLPFSEDYGKPVVIAGFEPLDVLQAILMLIQQVNQSDSRVENEYTRAVTKEGNTKAKALMNEVFGIEEQFEWRGFGLIPNSALRIRESFKRWDAEFNFDITTTSAEENKACICPAVLRGAKNPLECKLFGTACTPENPIGSCMVSSEGACAAYYSYGTQQKMEKGIQQ